MPNALKEQFPDFAAKLRKIDFEDQQEAFSEHDITRLQNELGVELPPSYKRFLRCTSGFSAFGGAVQIGEQHLFFHRFEPLEELSEQQRKIVRQKGGGWPPPSDGMLCFAEFFMEADGDQVLFDITQKDGNGEYPVFYYAHDGRPPTVRKIADTFEEWLNKFPDYPEFAEE